MGDEDCTVTNAELVYLKECLEGKRVYNDEDKWDFILNSGDKICNLVPTLKGEEVSLDDFDKYTPEKIEYYNRYICGDKIVLSQFVTLLLTNLGIETAVKLAPREVWEEALQNYE